MSKLGAAVRVLVLFLGAASVGAACAQTPAPTKVDSAAEAAAAMQRAQRLASNPMRVILEAGKIRRKGSLDDVPVEAADSASLRRTAARDIASTEAGSTTARALPDTVAAKPAPAAAEPRIAPAEPALGVTSSTLAAPPDAVPGLASIGAPAPVVSALPQSMPVLATLAAAKPRLIESTEPAFGARLAEEAARLTEVLADLTVRADGSVAQVELLSAVPRALQRPIIAALNQWRFAPLPATQTHRVQLVFGGS